jgi:CBS domain containing-hemolysin-like protein
LALLTFFVIGWVARCRAKNGHFFVSDDTTQPVTLFYPAMMLLLFFGLLLYTLVLRSEQALMRLSAHDLDLLRANEHRAAVRVIRLTEQLRATMAALVLARILLALLIGVGCINSLLTNYWFKTTLFDFSADHNLSGSLVWGSVGIVLTAGTTFLLWTLQKMHLLKNNNSNGSLPLQRLGLFVSFWKFLFSPFIYPGKKSTIDLVAAGSATDPVLSNAANSEKRELELLKSIVQFGDVTIKQVMQPRSKVVAVDFRATFAELLNIVCVNEFSRMPVIDEDLDNVMGILYVKDLVPHLDKPADFEWQPLIRTNLMLVPESKRGSELLQEFKQEKMHMAVVVDEYGGSAGIVTLEDILEEVIGDIRDEFDEDSDIRYRKLDDNNYLFEGQVLLNDVCRITGLPGNAFDTVRGNSDTLAGLALELRGDIPPVGEEIAWGQFLLTVIAANSRKIEQLKFTCC